MRRYWRGNRILSEEEAAQVDFPYPPEEGYGEELPLETQLQLRLELIPNPCSGYLAATTCSGGMVVLPRVEGETLCLDKFCVTPGQEIILALQEYIDSVKEDKEIEKMAGHIDVKVGMTPELQEAFDEAKNDRANARKFMIAGTILFIFSAIFAAIGVITTVT